MPARIRQSTVATWNATGMNLPHFFIEKTPLKSDKKSSTLYTSYLALHNTEQTRCNHLTAFSQILSSVIQFHLLNIYGLLFLFSFFILSQ